MSSSSYDEIEKAFDALGAILDRLCGLSFDALTTRELLAALSVVSGCAGRLDAVEHRLTN
jgi:hypothetical protein